MERRSKVYLSLLVLLSFLAVPLRAEEPKKPADDDYELYVLVRDAAEADSAFENGYGMTLSCFAGLRGAARPRRS